MEYERTKRADMLLTEIILDFVVAVYSVLLQISFFFVALFENPAHTN